ncbi:GmrSD restriction endonuclease domain-containing protein [Granulicoccus phenolivorans]|uniref:GmrSD restriction endonuclease domain-containing protein n=1 Tax=Granulicoccus phenolivorans TaxID=266854 RepID=UPI0004060027|nr:DUF1524 domain-containing protein [Granulicoccus phenolivorans]
MNKLKGCGCLVVVIVIVVLLLASCTGRSAETSAEPSADTDRAGAAATASGAAATPRSTSSRGGVSAPDATTTATATPRTARPGSALAMLYQLTITDRASGAGYDSALFKWREDVDRNGCDTRNDVLRRDLTQITVRSNGCVVLTGNLTSPYSGNSFDFIRGNGNNIEIDHVVSLSNSWQTGAQGFSSDRRVEFGNDPLNLLAVETSLNQQKGDGDAATWLPPKTSYRCEYVARQVAVKHKYGLWVTQPEFDAMERLLLDCNQPAASADPWPGVGAGDVAPTPSPTGNPQPQPAPQPDSNSGTGSTTGKSGAPPSKRALSDSDSTQSGSRTGGGSGPGTGAGGAYKNCTEARNRGGAPVRIGQPGYGPHLDRDGDGVGCEAKK